MNRRAHSGDDSSFARDAGSQTAKAAVLVVVAVIVGILLLRHTGTTSVTRTVSGASSHKATGIPPTTINPHPTSTTVTTPPIAPGNVKVLVLNGVSSTQPLAGNLSKQLQTAGYNTLAGDNATAKVTASAIYAVSSQYLSAASTLAGTLGLATSSVVNGLPTSAPVATRERTIANVVVVIGPDLATKAAGTTTGSSASTTTTAAG